MPVHSLFRRFVIIDKVISVEYFLDSITSFEMQMLIDNCRYSNITSWEQARFMAYWAGNSGRMRKSTKIEDLVPLAVDEKFKGSTEVDENALKWWKSLKNKKEGD